MANQKVKNSIKNLKIKIVQVRKNPVEKPKFKYSLFDLRFVQYEGTEVDEDYKMTQMRTLENLNIAPHIALLFPLYIHSDCCSEESRVFNKF